MGLINRHSHNWRAPSCILPRLREAALNDSVGTLLGKAGQMVLGWYQLFMGVGKKQQLQEALGFNDLNHSDDAWSDEIMCCSKRREFRVPMQSVTSLQGPQLSGPSIHNRSPLSHCQGIPTVDGPAKSCTTNLGWCFNPSKIMGCLPSTLW